VSGTPARLDVSMVDCALLGAHIAAQTSAAICRHAAKLACRDMLCPLVERIPAAVAGPVCASARYGSG